MSTYPLILLPHENYKSINCDLSSYFLIRHFNPQSNIPVINDLGEISQEYICDPSGNVGNLSLNLLGHFEAVHCQIALTVKGKVEFGVQCLPNYKGIPLQNVIDYTIDSNRQYWCVPFDKLCEIRVTYTTYDKKGKNGTVNVAKSFLIHDPAKWNFWHFVVDWDIDGKRLSDLDPKQGEHKRILDKIRSNARNKIAQMCKINLLTHPILPENCFKV